jgi:2-C-methyl-D-erythritol 2,4-cyclodiphosphate synthase
MEYRIGQGYDIHRFTEGKEMMLGGVKITSPRGFLGHSDGDVLLHALSDAVIGAAGLGDIGEHFPDTDPRFKNAPGVDLTTHLLTIVRDRGWTVVNTDLTVVMEEPKLHPYKERIRRKVAEILEVPPERVNLKAKTNEGMGPVGEGRAAQAFAVVLLSREES